MCDVVPRRTQYASRLDYSDVISEGAKPLGEKRNVARHTTKNSLKFILTFLPHARPRFCIDGPLYLPIKPIVHVTLLLPQKEKGTASGEIGGVGSFPLSPTPPSKENFVIASSTLLSIALLPPLCFSFSLPSPPPHFWYPSVVDGRFTTFVLDLLGVCPMPLLGGREQSKSSLGARKASFPFPAPVSCLHGGRVVGRRR